MSLNSIIRSGLSTIKTVTASMQGTILHSAWINQDAMGASVYGRRLEGLDIYGAYNAEGVAIERQCIIESKQRIREVNGRQIMTFATLTFPEQIEPNGMTTFRKEPFDPRDVIVLPDGTTGPIIDVVGVLDAETNRYYAVEVYLGDTLRLGGR